MTLWQTLISPHILGAFGAGLAVGLLAARRVWPARGAEEHRSD